MASSSSSKPGGDPTQQLLDHMRREQREGVRMSSASAGSSSFSNPVGDAHAANMQFLSHQMAAADLADELPGTHEIFRAMPHGLPPTGPALGSRAASLQPVTSQPGRLMAQQPVTSQPGHPMAQQPRHPAFAYQESFARPEHAHQHPGQFRAPGNWMPFRPGPMIPQVPHVPPMQQHQQPIASQPELQDQATTSIYAEEEFDALMNEWMLKEGFDDQVRQWSTAQVAYQATPALGAAASQGIANFVNGGQPVTEPIAIAAAPDQQLSPEDKPLSSTDLAHAAQQLVDAVSDNQSEKFRNSSFVDLMRRIAAQEVVIQDNNLVEASEATHPAPNASEQPADIKGKGKADAHAGSD